MEDYNFCTCQGTNVTMDAALPGQPDATLPEQSDAALPEQSDAALLEQSERGHEGPTSERHSKNGADCLAEHPGPSFGESADASPSRHDYASQDEVSFFRCTGSLFAKTVIREIISHGMHVSGK